jgi:hypothetical protein
MIRQIVTNEFEVTLRVHVAVDPDNFESKAGVEDHRNTLHDKYYLAMYHLCRLESLRSLKPKIYQDKYPRERSKLIASHRRARHVDAY